MSRGEELGDEIFECAWSAVTKSDDRLRKRAHGRGRVSLAGCGRALQSALFARLRS